MMEPESLIEQLRDPARSNAALLALLGEGRHSVRPLADFLRNSRPSTVAESRLLAVEGLSILRGTEAMEALIEVASQRLEEIADPVVRLAEESVASRAALALADFDDPRAREALLALLHRKPLAGVAEALEKLRDGRAIPRLVEWLEEDFVAEPASRAILAYGRGAIPSLLACLRKKKIRSDSETGMSQRRRSRILELLSDLARTEEISSLEYLLDEAVEVVRLRAIQLFLRCGTLPQKRAAYRSGLALVDSRDHAIRSTCEELLISYRCLGSDLLQREIELRRARGESEEPMYPRESTLAMLVRIARRSAKRKEGPA
jgi:HEAT repeat protein